MRCDLGCLGVERHWLQGFNIVRGSWVSHPCEMLVVLTYSTHAGAEASTYIKFTAAAEYAPKPVAGDFKGPEIIEPFSKPF